MERIAMERIAMERIAMERIECNANSGECLLVNYRRVVFTVRSICFKCGRSWRANHWA